MNGIEKFFQFIFLKGFKNFEIRLLPKPNEKLNYENTSKT